MDQVQDALRFLAQADADTRAALVAIAHECDVTLKNDNVEPSHSAVNALLMLKEKPLDIAVGLLGGNGIKRGRPRGSKNRKDVE